jgi:hypothetical protein
MKRSLDDLLEKVRNFPSTILLSMEIEQRTSKTGYARSLPKSSKGRRRKLKNPLIRPPQIPDTLVSPDFYSHRFPSVPSFEL